MESMKFENETRRSVVQTERVGGATRQVKAGCSIHGGASEQYEEDQSKETG